MDNQTKEAFQSTSDAFKQMMTLSTGVLTLEITLLKDIVNELPILAGIALGASWISFLLSLLFGIAGLLAITGSLGQVKNLSPSSIYANNVRIPALVQVISFGFGMLLTVVFGLTLLKESAFRTLCSIGA